MERRHFLRNLGFSGMLAAIPSVLTRASAQKNKDAIVTGKVHSKGKGIGGVAVTDGRNVVLTDKNGNYELPANEAAEFVYISVPSGYAFPANNGIASFYKPLQEGGKYDFSLDKLPGSDKKHCFVVWADTQMISKKDAEQLKTESAPDLKALVQSYSPGTLFHGIGCGDLVWDKFDLFADYKEAIAMTGVPFFNVIGNHDMDLDSRTDDYSAKTFKQQFGPTYYSFNRGDIHYVVLDDVFFVGTAKKYIGYITENQLSWLEKDLAHVKPGSTVVVSLHIPTNTGAARRNKKDEELGGTVSNRRQLYKILAPYKVHIMSGHTHFNECWEDNNIMEHNHGTVCGAWWTGPVCGDGTPNGYGVYEVDGSELKWYYKSTGKPKEHQLRIYAPGRSVENPGEMVVNVWNWDPKWKVEWWEDGQFKGVMEQRTGLDPWATELYRGPQLPAKHKFVEPTLADHLFYARPTAGVKKIMVRATDRFGSVFVEEISMT
ncbi:MAG TPA: calcineurin-like phosphoesterase family protein [Chitinophagaceae bacterium]|nr:calcineurin-like phosphoesterase family protein [Chitinophagaceae bacterium]